MVLFRDQTGVQAAIDIIANIIEYALGSRLQKIRATLPDSNSISPNTISNSPLPVIFQPPLTPNKSGMFELFLLLLLVTQLASPPVIHLGFYCRILPFIWGLAVFRPE